MFCSAADWVILTLFCRVLHQNKDKSQTNPKHSLPNCPSCSSHVQYWSKTDGPSLLTVAHFKNSFHWVGRNFGVPYLNMLYMIPLSLCFSCITVLLLNLVFYRNFIVSQFSNVVVTLSVTANCFLSFAFIVVF